MAMGDITALGGTARGRAKTKARSGSSRAQGKRKGLVMEEESTNAGGAESERETRIATAWGTQESGAG